jgi:hypothetical protein
MKVVNTGKYRKKGTGNIVHRHEIVGTDAEKAAFLASKSAQFSSETGEPLVAENGNPLWMSPRFEGASRLGSISEAGNLVLGDTEATAMEELAEQYYKAGKNGLGDKAAEKAIQLQQLEMRAAIEANKPLDKAPAEKDLNP